MSKCNSQDPSENDQDTTMGNSQTNHLDGLPTPQHCDTGDSGGLPGDFANSTSDSAPNPFDPASLRLSQDFASGAAVKRVLTTIRCRKPHGQEFFRVRPGERWRLETVVLEDKVNREDYLVAKNLWPELAREVFPACLFLATNRQGETFVWRCRLPGSDGRSNAWWDSALKAAQLAETKWTKLIPDPPASMYDTKVAVAEFPEPEWPDLGFEEILRICFQERFIQNSDHPLLRALRGEV